jgi:hypothetical protein
MQTQQNVPAIADSLVSEPSGVLPKPILRLLNHEKRLKTSKCRINYRWRASRRYKCRVIIVISQSATLNKDKEEKL